MTGLDTILPKPRVVQRSAKQRFLERDARRRERAAEFFEAFTEARAAALTETYAARTVAKAKGHSLADSLLGRPTTPLGEKAPETSAPETSASQTLTAEQLLAGLD